jgi:hypothetical protein
MEFGTGSEPKYLGGNIMKAERNVHGNGDYDAARKYGDANGNSTRNRVAETALAAPGGAAEEARQAEVPALLRPKIKASPWQDRR